MFHTEEKYKKVVVPALKKEFGFTNTLAVPRLTKVVLNIGTGRALKEKDLLETMSETLRRITGQKPVQRVTNKSISNFKIREGMVVGLQVTLRGKRMYQFLDRFINSALPRIRDFKGISAHQLDRQGNLNIGIREHTVFPEIRSDEVEKIHGLQVTISTTAQDPKVGRALFTGIGLPLVD